jgi:hypothetical protein
MSVLFKQCAGAVARIDTCAGGGGGGAIFNVTINNTPITFPVTGVVMEMQGNYQFLHALDKFVYFYSFGDRIGELTVSGLGFAKDPTATDNCTLSDANICDLYTFYLAKRQSATKSALTIGIGGCAPAFKGFLTGMRLEVSSNVGGVPIGQWSLRFHTIPENT